ncbi:MAG: DUF6364 family protein [Balneolales bacterium]
MKFKFNKQNKVKTSTQEKNAPEKKPVNVFVRTEKELIDSAREYARENNCSISQLVGNYFRVIHERKKLPLLQYPSSKLLKGLLKDTRHNRADYLKYLQEKYQ